MIPNEEFLARILKPNWISMGKVSSAAFSLRAHINESYISVLREQCESFNKDTSRNEKSISKDRK